MSYSIYGFSVPSSLLWPATIVLASLFFLLFRTRFPAQTPMAQSASTFENVRVTKIFVHPVKSCRGTAVQSVRYTPEGVEYDRNWAVIDATSHTMITARQTANMVLIHPRIILDQSSSYRGRLEVSFPRDSGCDTFSVPLHPTRDILRNWETTDRLNHFHHQGIDGYICQSLSPSSQSPSAILSKYFGRPVHLAFKGPVPRPCEATPRFPALDASIRYQDQYPLLVASEESLEALERNIRPFVGAQGVADKWKNEKLDMERFRPNFVFKGSGIPFSEDTWGEITIGPQRQSTGPNIPIISMVRKCTRCLLPNVDHKTGIRDPAVPFKVLMKTRNEMDKDQKMQVLFGAQGVSKGDGVARVGDWVTVRKMASM